MSVDPIPWTGLAFGESDPQATSDGARTWVLRAANFVVAYSEMTTDAILEHDGPDEHMVLVPAGSSVQVATDDDKSGVTGTSLAIVPPGRSTVTATAPGAVARVFTVAGAPGLAAAAANAGAYARHPENTARHAPWPDPVDGFRLRIYDVDSYPLDPAIVGRLFRSTNLMINVFPIRVEKRDVTKMTPHSHDDFEQCSLALLGDYVHHLRYPWTPNLPAWRPDEHPAFPTPSAIIFPATVIHTSETVGESGNWQIVDIFGPPRLDFSRRAGFVRNADEYPMPES